MTGGGRFASTILRNDRPMSQRTPRYRDGGSMATLRRFALRLLVITAFAALWPDPSIPSATETAILCLAFAAGCALAAIAFREPVRGSGLNRWHEAAGLAIIALVAYLAF
jgi:hypothetical protein